MTMNRFSRWWNKSKLEKQEMNNRLRKLEYEMHELTDANISLKTNLSSVETELKFYKTKEEEDEAKRSSEVPWVEVKSDSYDKVKGIQIALDWNDAFIAYLIENGITGRDDDTIIQKWLALLYQDLILKLDQQSIDNSDIITAGDFE